MTISVILKQDYSESEIFEYSGGLSINEIKEEVDKRFPIWWYYDILTDEQEQSLKRKL